MSSETIHAMPPDRGRKLGWFKILLLVIAVAVVTSILTVWIMTTYLFPKEFKPVQLNAREEKVLDAKLDRLDTMQLAPRRAVEDKTESSASSGEQADILEAERYSEEGASREITFTERELNALLAKNTPLARKLVIDLSDNLASAKLLVPLDPDFPFLGGKTLKVTAGLELRYSDQNPIVALRGISIWGVPIPNAWLGGIKNVDLVGEFGAGKGFWRTFADGLENIRVEEGRLNIKLKE